MTSSLTRRTLAIIAEQNNSAEQCYQLLCVVRPIREAKRRTTLRIHQEMIHDGNWLLTWNFLLSWYQQSTNRSRKKQQTALWQFTPWACAAIDSAIDMLNNPAYEMIDDATLLSSLKRVKQEMRYS